MAIYGVEMPLSTSMGSPLFSTLQATTEIKETDLAFTYMFGGFSRQFYDGYQSVYPINDGFSQRKILYNLYHELNHFNLFGGGYANSAQSSIHSLIHYLA